jgi:hypothetical protein
LSLASIFPAMSADILHQKESRQFSISVRSSVSCAFGKVPGTPPGTLRSLSGAVPGSSSLR